VTSTQTPWLTQSEAADYARRSVGYINKALRDGSLRGSQTKRGGDWRIHRDDLDAWIRGEVATVEPARVARRRAS